MYIILFNQQLSYSIFDDVARREAKMYRQRHPLRSKFNVLRARAKHRGVEFTVQLEDFDLIQFCPVLSIELNWFANAMQDNSPSFDRLDPNVGYVPGNVVIISMKANRIKNDATIEELQAILDWLRGLYDKDKEVCVNG